MSSTMLKHTHTCIKCGTHYSHRHPARSADHEQFAFQCVNPNCEWHPSKGAPKSRPETWDEDGEEFVWPQAEKKPKDRDATAEKKPRTETYKARSVRLAFERDDIKCGNADHFSMATVAGEQFKQVRPRPALEILRDMEPFAKCKCPCERKACREAWTWDNPGTLTTEWVVNGLYYKGVGKPEMLPKRVMPVRYRLNEKQFEEVHSRFPDWYIVQVGNDGHDHPVSHTITQIATYEMFRSIRRGSKVLDMHGNPAANNRQKSSTGLDIKTAVCLVTAKDHVRAATKWVGQEYHEVGYIRDMHRDHADLLGDRNVITSVHTSYYYDMKEIVTTLQACERRATWVALMHRFDGEEGKLNNGELKWSRVGRDIRQSNVATGESYQHPDNRQWFEADAWASTNVNEVLDDESPADWTRRCEAMESLAWTKTEVTPGTYRLTATLVPNKVAVMELNGDLTKPVWAPEVVRFEVAGTKREFVLRRDLKPLFEECRKAAVNKPRDERQFKAHCGTVSSKANAFWSQHQVKVDATELAQIQMSSFWIDFQSQAAEVATFNVISQFWVNQHKQVLTGMTLGKVENLIDALFVITDKALEAQGGRSTLKAMHGVFTHLRTK